MAIENDFQNRRIENRKLHLKEKKESESKRNVYIQKVFSQCDKVQQALKPFADEAKIAKEFVFCDMYRALMHRLLGYKTSGDISEEVLDMGLKEAEKAFNDAYLGRIPLSEIITFMVKKGQTDLESKVSKYKKIEFKKFLKQVISNMERKMGSYLAMLSSSANNLKKMVNNPLYSTEDDTTKSFLGTLNQISGIAQIEGYAEFGDVCKKIKGDLSDDFVKKSEEYRKAVLSIQPASSKIMDVAINNIKLLDDELKFIENKKKGYFNSLEGLLLGYNAYRIESEKAQEDEEYSQFLYNKSEEKLSLLKSKNGEDIKITLGNLRRHGRISDNEAIFMKVILEREFKIEKEEQKKSFEDINFMAEIISSYGISPVESVKIAELANCEDIDRISQALTYKFKELSEALIEDNPKLFLLDARETERYIGRLEESIELMKDYDEVDDFNPVKSPHNFSSFDALKETRIKFYNLIRKIGVTEQKTGQEKHISELDNIRLNMAREGFEPDVALAILRRGFYFRNQYFTGDHRIGEEHLVKNTQRDKGIDFEERGFLKELKKLIRAGAVLDNRGYSLNDKTKEIQSEALKGAVAYVLTHHPLEEE